MSMQASSLIVSALILASFTTAHGAPTVVNACGEVVTDGVLANDLDCSGTAGAAITIVDNGDLDLAGHTLQSGSGNAATGIHCDGKCTIVGNGGTVASGVAALPGSDAETIGVYGRRVSLSGTTVTGYALGASAEVLDIEASFLIDNLFGASGNRIRINTSTVSNDTGVVDQAVDGRRVDITDSVLDGGNGVIARKTKIYGSMVTGMQSHGIVGNVYAEGSVIDGNCTMLGYSACADLTSPGKPRLVDSTCSHSIRKNSDVVASWSVCSLD
jgi:hypothetical protein